MLLSGGKPFTGTRAQILKNLVGSGASVDNRQSIVADPLEVGGGDSLARVMVESCV